MEDEKNFACLQGFFCGGRISKVITSHHLNKIKYIAQHEATMTEMMMKHKTQMMEMKAEYRAREAAFVLDMVKKAANDVEGLFAKYDNFLRGVFVGCVEPKQDGSVPTAEEQLSFIRAQFDRKNGPHTEPWFR